MSQTRELLNRPHRNSRWLAFAGRLALLPLGLAPLPALAQATASPDSYSTAEDTTLNVAAPGVLGNDSGSGPLTAALVTGVSHGALTLNSDGSFSYTPTSNYNGPDSFTYSADDGLLPSLPATVTITVTAVNDAPTANGDSYTTPEDTQLSVNPPNGVLANDTDVEGDQFTAAVVSQPSHGTLSLNANGSFTYTPSANYSGPDSFTYQATDNGTPPATSAAATVSITVSPVNDPPTANNDSYSTPEDTALNVASPGVLGNDTDVEGNALTAAVVSQPSHGSLTLNANGSFTYTPSANYNGPDSFTYQATDNGSPAATSAAATVSITVSPVNDPPTANNDSYSTPEDTPLNVASPGVLGNDTDVEGNAFTAAVVSQPSHGSLTLNANGSFTYTPSATYNGPDSFTYHATDNGSPAATSAAATVSITVSPVNDPPVANPDSYSTPEDTALVVPALTGVLANDTDIEGNALTAAVVSQPSHGSLTLNANGSFTYTPSTNYSGPDSFTYQATDNGTPPATSAAATVSITVSPVNDPPTANDDTYGTPEDTPLNVASPGVLGNDTDPEGNAFTAAVVSQPAHGSLTLNANGSFTYTPSANYNGPDSFTYHATDNGSPAATSAAATVSITVSPVNDPPTANNDSYSTPEDTPLNVAAPGVLGNDTDPDGNTLTSAVVDQPTHGSLTLNANGSFTYTPSANYNGPDSFTYQVTDNGSPAATSGPATVSITVSPVNDPPTANPDTYSTPEDTPLNIAAPGVLGNDTDPEGNDFTAAVVSQPAHGSLTLNPDGSFTYTPSANYNGPDSFTYQATDNGAPPATSAPATVSITVSPVNDPPVAVADNYTVNEDTTLSAPAPGVLANDADPDGTVLTPIKDSDPTNGTLTLNPNGSFTYAPNPNFFGQDSFTYHVTDQGAPLPALSSGTVTVTITVMPVNDPPSGGPVDLTDLCWTEHVFSSRDVAPFFTDPENDPITFQIDPTTPLPDDLSMSPDGVLSGTPPLGTTDTGDFTVNLIASDGTDDLFTTVDFCVVKAGRADLALAVDAAPGPALINQPVTWSFTINNRSQVDVGNIALGADFSGDVPFTLTSAQTGCTITPQGSNTHLDCAAGPIGAGASIVLQATGSSSQAGDVLTSGTVSITDPVPIDETPENDSASGSLNVAQSLSSGPAQQIASTENRASAAGDLNGDGYTDLAVATGPDQATLIFPNIVDPANENRRVLSDTPTALGDQGPGTAVAVADLDGDGALDIVAAYGAGRANTIFMNLNPGDGSFSFSPLPDALGQATDASRAVAVGDVNGDLLPDIVFANGSPNPVFTNTGGMAFAEADLGNADSVDVALADLFGDPLPELVFANADGDAAVYRNTGGVFTHALDIPTGPTTSVAVADFDGDGKNDLVFGRAAGATPSDAPSNLVYINTSASTPGFFPGDRLGASPTLDVLTADINEDGAIDIVAINATGGHQVYVNNGNGQFVLYSQQFASPGALAAVSGKFSVDDRVDVAVTGTNGDDIFFNDGRGNLGPGDTGKPVIRLLGSQSISLDVQEPFADPGAQATDDMDGDLTSLIVVDNPVDTAVVGTYTVTYNVTDSSGNSAVPVTRTVQVGARVGTGGGGGGAVGGLAIAVLGLLVFWERRGRTGGGRNARR